MLVPDRSALRFGEPTPNTIAAVAEGSVWELRDPPGPNAKATAAANAITICVDAKAGQIVNSCRDIGAFPALKKSIQQRDSVGRLVLGDGREM
jgi:hypothetical protein